MSKQTNTRPSWAKNAAKSVKYTAEEVVSNRMPFTTNTVRNMIAQNVANVDKYKGIPIEICLEALNDEET